MSDTTSSSKGNSYYGHNVIHLNYLRTKRRGWTPLKLIVSKIQALDNGAVQMLIEDSRDTSKEAIYYGYNLANATLGRSSTFAYGDIKQLKLPYPWFMSPNPCPTNTEREYKYYKSTEKAHAAANRK